MSLLISSIPEEKPLLIESAAKRDKDLSIPSNVYLLVSFAASVLAENSFVFLL